MIKNLKTNAARLIRLSIEDGRSDASLWGHLVENGDDVPLWNSNAWRWSLGGGSRRRADLYANGYRRSYRKAVRKLWADASDQEIREAEAAVKKNRKIYREGSKERELREIREELQQIKGKLDLFNGSAMST